MAIALCTTSLHSPARGIRHIVVDKVAASAGTTEEEQMWCERFRPTAAQIKRYFLRAYPVDFSWSVNKYYSPCYAKGRIEYADGSRGTWTLKSSGIAGIVWEGSGDIVLFHEKNGWFDPFGPYGDNGV